ncbi:MAG: hypothetical protein DRP45_02335 [Candidatus Zixiibacteriota bacterium]|nr:MAG: hypothetical protein DRP45_02335 [candidate division Zixibacteria bacterium]
MVKCLVSIRTIILFSLCCALVLPYAASSAEKMPPEKAGEMGSPTGKIAFIRDKNIWTMDAHGGHQMKICEATNADGRLSWAPDGKRIAFTRSGRVDLHAPDLLGGQHKVYDIFVAYVDSAEAGSTYWWLRLTDGLGARDPEWSADGKTIIFYQDMNANRIDAEAPNYQICTMDNDGGNLKVLRKDWQNMSEYFVSPSMNADGEIAFVHFVTTKPNSSTGQAGGFRAIGIAKLHRDNIMAPLESVRTQSAANESTVAPAWSPDGKWIAYAYNSIEKPGMWIATPDFSEKYLVFEPPPGTSLFTMSPSFSPNSKWLTFATTDGSIWICDITGNGAKRLSGPGLDYAPAWSK